LLKQGVFRGGWYNIIIFVKHPLFFEDISELGHILGCISGHKKTPSGVLHSEESRRGKIAFFTSNKARGHC
jgi:hypothetical protein